MNNLLLTIAALCQLGDAKNVQICQKEYVQCLRDKKQQSPMKGRDDEFLWECTIEILKVK